MISIGIDPGLSGAIVAIDDQLRVVGCYDTPIVSHKSKRAFDAAGMVACLRDLTLDDSASCCVTIEQASARPMQGATSGIKTGIGFGLWQGIVAALDLPYRIVRPQEWQSVLKGMAQLGKQRAFVKASQLFPKMELRGPQGAIKDGRADAACIAYYGIGGAK